MTRPDGMGQSLAKSVAAFSAALSLSICQAHAQSNLKDLDYLKSKPYDQLTPADITAAKAAAKKHKIDQIVFCADPGNMPLSNDKREGFQNKIAELVSAKLGARALFFWRPYLDRGLTRETFDNHECEILLDMPVGEGTILLTTPIYRSTYVFAYRADKGLNIQNFDDLKDKDLKIGVFQHSAMRQSLSRRGIKVSDVHVITQDADLRPENQPWRQVQRVIDGELDVAGVWGPFAGWLKTMKGEHLAIVPANTKESKIPLEFSLAMGIQKTDIVLKFALENAMDDAKDEITKILNDYGVPLVQCSDCVVQGTLPSQGILEKPLQQAYEDRYLKSAPAILPTKDASPDQVVSTERMEAWLADGADPTAELCNAVLSGDPQRVMFLISKGADVNARDTQGFAPLDVAARTRHSDLVRLLLDHKANPNIADNDGMTPLLYAIMRNHVPSIEALKSGGADIEHPGKGGHLPLFIALGEGHLFAAKALMDAGASVSAASGPEMMTPLMAVATQITPHQRLNKLAAGPSPNELAEELIKRGANVNATTAAGVTALMIAAGHNNTPMIGLLLRGGADAKLKSQAGKTALDIAMEANHEAAIAALKFLVGKSASAETGSSPEAPQTK